VRYIVLPLLDWRLRAAAREIYRRGAADQAQGIHIHPPPPSTGIYMTVINLQISNNRAGQEERNNKGVSDKEEGNKLRKTDGEDEITVKLIIFTLLYV
jgi:hypothetical protein